MVKVHNLGKQNSILNQFVSELRDSNIQKDSLRFRQNMQRIGCIFAYEISKSLNYRAEEIITPLGVSPMSVLAEYPVLVTILRAGLPFHNGFLEVFDKSSNSFISAYRKYSKGGKFTIQIEYVSSPDITNKNLIISDPMLATGSSMVLSYNELIQKGTPMHTHIATIIASKEGIEYIRKKLNKENITIWTAAIDEELTAQAYIVPGLGDAGDLAFGGKE